MVNTSGCPLSQHRGMSWKQIPLMEQRLRFVLEWQANELSKAELCRRYGIQRRIGYKWWQRYQQFGVEGLRDQSRAPHSSPQQLGAAVVDRIVELRGRFPTWGAPKIRAHLERSFPGEVPPAPSTIGEVLRQAGLTRPQGRRRRAPPRSQPLAHAVQPNQVWTIDFKGWFRTADGARCEPLTLLDAASRYLFRCQAVSSTSGSQVRRWLEAAFREYGLPQRIRSDNGAPFVGIGLGGLSRLSVWWLKLGILPERIRPATPSENGRHERFHLTLKQHTAQPPAAHLRAQQRRFDQFRQHYNHERPHEALGQQPPALFYQPSARPYPCPLREPLYACGWLQRRVEKRGQMRWRGGKLFVGSALAGEAVGLEAVGEGLYRVWYGPIPLGLLDERRSRIVPPPRPRRRQPRRPATPPAGVDTAADEFFKA